MSLFTTLPIKPIDTAAEITSLFNAVFFEAFNTCCKEGQKNLFINLLPVVVGEGVGATVVAAMNSTSAIIYFRNDYLASALHEISHWTIAGEQRRQLEDYGYWYEADERTHDVQTKFEEVEVKPQAVELLLHITAGLPFQISVDNLSLPDYDSEPFSKVVMQQARLYCDVGIPVRAKIFMEALITRRGYRLPHLGFSLESYLLNELASL